MTVGDRFLLILESQSREISELKGMMVSFKKEIKEEFKSDFESINAKVKENSDNIGDLKVKIDTYDDSTKKKTDEIESRISNYEKDQVKFMSELDSSKLKIKDLENQMESANAKYVEAMDLIKSLQIENADKTKSLEFNNDFVQEIKVKVENNLKISEQNSKDILRNNNETKGVITSINEIKSKHESDMESINNEVRKSYLILKNIPLTPNENTLQMIRTLVTNGIPELDSSAIVDAYRIKQFNNGRGRQVPLIKCVIPNPQVKEMIINNIKDVRDTNRNQHIWVERDMCSSKKGKYMDIRACFRKLTSKKVDAKMQGMGILLNGTIYRRHDLNKLPDGFKLYEVSQLENKEATEVFFAGPNSYLSNFCSTGIKWNGMSFCSSEQLFQ